MQGAPVYVAAPLRQVQVQQNLVSSSLSIQVTAKS